MVECNQLTITIVLYSPDGYHGNLEKPQEHIRKLRIRKVKFKWITKVFGAIFLNLVNNHYRRHCRSTRRPRNSGLRIVEEAR